jgi:hypothetical protein
MINTLQPECSNIGWSEILLEVTCISFGMTKFIIQVSVT